MPDYNAAVAAGIQPPAPVQQQNFGNTLSTVADFQRAQIQALQQTRQYNALQAASQAAQAGGDSGMAYMRAGGDPGGLSQIQSFQANQRFMATHGGNMPQGAEANANIALRGAETTNAKAQLPGYQAKSEQENMTLRGGIAQSLAADPSDSNWKATVPQLIGHVSPQGMAQILDAYKNPDKRAQVAKNMIAAALPPADATKLEQTEPGKGFTSPLERLAQPVGNQPQAVQAQAAPLNQPQTAGQLPTAGVLGGRPTPSVGAVETGKLDAQQYSKLLGGLQGAGNNAASMLPHIQMAKALINSPDFYSGSAEGAVLGYKRFLAATGIDPGASLPQEAFRKTMAANILNQVDDLKATATEMGAGSSRIFASQIDLMEKAAQNPDNSVAANRFLTELSDRAAQRGITLADKAADYKQAHGSLDVGFEKDLRGWMAKNPMFTAKELANPETIGAPAKAAPSSFQEGQTATNPKTGAKMTFTNGKWQ